jgi:polar amino acid transport system permease protein
MPQGFQFEAVFEHFDELLYGAFLTIQLSASAIALGMALAIICLVAKLSGPSPVRFLASAYVEVIRNTPFLVQLFFLYFGVSSLGFRISPNLAALLTLAINLSAYAAEILRSGVQAVPRGIIEAGTALGLSQFSIFKDVILKPALQNVYPALGSQFIIVMLTTSVVSAISADELSSKGADIQSITFASFEVYFIITLIYLSISILFSAIIYGLGYLFFGFARAR